MIKHISTDQLISILSAQFIILGVLINSKVLEPLYFLHYAVIFQSHLNDFGNL